MSMRTWIRKMAHEKASANGVRHQNKLRYNPSTGNRAPSWFSENWKRAACMDIPKTKKQKETKRDKALRREKRAIA